MTGGKIIIYNPDEVNITDRISGDVTIEKPESGRLEDLKIRLTRNHERTNNLTLNAILKNWDKEAGKFIFLVSGNLA